MEKCIVVESVHRADLWGVTRLAVSVSIHGIPLLVTRMVGLRDVKVLNRAGDCLLVCLEDGDAERLWSMIEEEING